MLQGHDSSEQAGFLKSSAKITLYPKISKRSSLAIRSPVPSYASLEAYSGPPSPTRYGTPPVRAATSPAPARDTNATWVCPICSFSNPVPSNFDPGTANAQTPLPPCLACGIKPPLVHVVKAAIAAMSNRSTTSTNDIRGHARGDSLQEQPKTSLPATNPSRKTYIECPRCTFQNHPSLNSCEICGASLPSLQPKLQPQLERAISRTGSPAPATSTANTESGNEILKLSFRAGGDKIFYERLKDALIQRKWLLQSAPSVPRPENNFTSPNTAQAATPPPRQIGIAGLERRGQELRRNNEIVIGSAFEDLEALMTSAKEVIAMAERFAASNPSSEASALVSQSASALGLVTTRDMLAPGSSNSETLYLTQLSRDLAEYLTDDRHGVLRREGGIISLVDLWAVFNRRRNGIELISPLDFEKAARLWEDLKLPVRLRRFRSGVLVVQGRDRTDEKTVKALLDWLAEFHHVPPDAYLSSNTGVAAVTWDWTLYGRGVTAQETAGRFGWSVGVATEELEMAEEKGLLVREQDAQGVRFWENAFEKIEIEIPRPRTPDDVRQQREIERMLEDSGLL